MADSFEAETGAEARESPEKEARRWLLEISLAEKREKEWRKTGHKILERYRGTKRRANSFNVLWSNTEVLRPALYNSEPKPDVRRRFRQTDVLGKAVGEVEERGLSYCVDAYDMDSCLKDAVLTALLPGRAITRVRYIAAMKKGGNDSTPVGREALDYEQAMCEIVEWDDYRQGPGKRWGEVLWIAFRHRLRRDDLVERFGAEIGKKITLNATDEDSVEKGGANEDLGEVFKRAEVWEIWDKEGKRVFFVNDSYKEGLLFTKDAPDGEPPLALKNFYPIPRPLQMVEDTGCLIPIPIYTLYEQQAIELDRISTRINKLINAARVRGMYDATLTEFAELMKADDNDLLPVTNARAWMNNGGMEKALWWMPVEQIAKVLAELYVARESTKKVIYELTGISDIQRGDTNANETLGAQQLKADFGNQRMKRMQREVQRYSRDLIRLLAEVIGEHFARETLAQMTGLRFPTALQKQELTMQAQGMQQQQQPVPEDLQNALKMPSWEDIMKVLKSDIQREYRVDVETDSTVADSLAQDLAGLTEVITGLVRFWEGVGPAVVQGAISMEAVKSISMTIVRRARMGLEVEDALETGMQQPKPQAAGEQEAPDHSREVATIKAQADAQVAQVQAQGEAQAATIKVNAEAQLEAQKQAFEAEQQLREQASDERMKKLEADVKVLVAQIGAKAALDQSAIAAEQKASADAAQE